MFNVQRAQKEPRHDIHDTESGEGGTNSVQVPHGMHPPALGARAACLFVNEEYGSCMPWVTRPTSVLGILWQLAMDEGMTQAT